MNWHHSTTETYQSKGRGSPWHESQSINHRFSLHLSNSNNRPFSVEELVQEYLPEADACLGLAFFNSYPFVFGSDDCQSVHIGNHHIMPTIPFLTRKYDPSKVDRYITAWKELNMEWKISTGRKPSTKSAKARSWLLCLPMDLSMIFVHDRSRRSRVAKESQIPLCRFSASHLTSSCCHLKMSSTIIKKVSKGAYD